MVKIINNLLHLHYLLQHKVKY